MRYDKNMDNYREQIANIYANLDDDVLVKLEKKISKLESEIRYYKQDLRVCEDEDLILRDIINNHIAFNYKHRIIIKVLKFIDKIIIKLPRVRFEWRK